MAPSRLCRIRLLTVLPAIFPESENGDKYCAYLGCKLAASAASGYKSQTFSHDTVAMSASLFDVGESLLQGKNQLPEYSKTSNTLINIVFNTNR